MTKTTNIESLTLEPNPRNAASGCHDFDGALPRCSWHRLSGASATLAFTLAELDRAERVLAAAQRKRDEIRRRLCACELPRPQP